MIIYVDSSALVKMFVEEEGSPAIKKFGHVSFSFLQLLANFAEITKVSPKR